MCSRAAMVCKAPSPGHLLRNSSFCCRTAICCKAMPGDTFVDALAIEIENRLGAFRPADSANWFTATDLRRWVVEHLKEYDDELARFPTLAGQPHWNLWMTDGEAGDALFAVLVFRADGVELFPGAGDPAAVRDWSVNTEALPDGIRAEAGREFRIGDSLRIDRASAEAWLGRGW